MKKLMTEMGSGNIVFSELEHGLCYVWESEDPYMPTGTYFPAKDLKKLNCETEVVE